MLVAEALQSRKRPDSEGASVDTWLEGGGVGADGDLSLPTCATVARFSVFLRLPLSLHPQHLSLIIRFLFHHSPSHRFSSSTIFLGRKDSSRPYQVGNRGQE